MTTQSFPAGEAPRVVLSEIRGDLTIEAWAKRAIEVECDGRIDRIDQGEEAVVIQRAYDDIVLRVPADAEVVAEQVAGDMSCRGVRALSLSACGGDVDIDEIAESIRLDQVGGSVVARDSSSLTLLSEVGGDVDVSDVALVEIERVSGDLQVSGAQSATIGNVDGDCQVTSTESFRYGNIGGDLQVSSSARAAVVGGSVGGDTSIHAAASVQLGNVGGDCHIDAVSGEVRLGSLGGDCHIDAVSGAVWLGSVGGDASVRAKDAGVQIGNVGGDLHLGATFPAGSSTRISVGGDAAIELPRQPSLTIRATVGGDVSGERIVSSGGGMFTAVYGEGGAQLDLIVGGDLQLSGGGSPRTSSSSWDWSEFSADMGRMGDELGREFSKLGEQIERELSGAFGPHGPGRKDWERKLHRRVEERVRHAESEAQRAAERARRSAERLGRPDEPGQRMHVRINDREWRFDAERLERMKQQAREAAREGLTGAISAIERALAGMGVPPEPPTPPDVPRQPVPPAAPAPPRPAATGQTIRIDVGDPASASAANEVGAGEPAAGPPASAEEERTAILQMVAEGRISPEEGDMLLDALG
ncbi:MAG: hypothetical protein IPO81_29915 [Kouleothrix sp.]|nr:hypothetical protein [Kouleothrix sp.]